MWVAIRQRAAILTFGHHSHQTCRWTLAVKFLFPFMYVSSAVPWMFSHFINVQGVCAACVTAATALPGQLGSSKCFPSPPADDTSARDVGIVPQPWLHAALLAVEGVPFNLHAQTLCMIVCCWDSNLQCSTVSRVINCCSGLVELIQSPHSFQLRLGLSRLRASTRAKTCFHLSALCCSYELHVAH